MPDTGYIPGKVLTTITGAQAILTTALTLVALYKRTRESVVASDPTADGKLPTVREVALLLDGDADHLIAHADALLLKYAASKAENGT